MLYKVSSSAAHQQTRSSVIELVQSQDECRKAHYVFLMLSSAVDPHRLGFAGAFEALAAVETDSLLIGGQHLLMEACVF